jgi:hypothetical protein
MPDYSAEFNQNKAADRPKAKPKGNPNNSASEISDVEFMLIGLVGVTNDLCDWIGLDLILFRILDLSTAGILGLWCVMRLRKFPSARFGTTFLVELIPGLGDLSPTWTVFIASVYAEQKGYLPKTLAKTIKAK